MDSFFNILRKALIASVFVSFTMLATYVPQPHTQVVYAGGAGGGSTFVQQVVDQVIQLVIQAIESAANSLLDASKWYAQNEWLKEFFLDGAAWSLAKGMVGGMAQDVVSWINAGFEGNRPMFVQNIQDYLRETGDDTMDEFLDELTSPDSYICSPFKVDVAKAVATKYTNQDRVDIPTPKCVLDGVFTDLDGFLNSEPGSFSQEGWSGWLAVTSAPEMYTPFGAVEAAKQTVDVRIIKDKSEQESYLDYASGFLSSKICSKIKGPAGNDIENCSVTSPGKILQETLSSHLDTTRQTLINADELDEFLTAFVSKVGKFVFDGSGDLLDL